MDRAMPNFAFSIMSCMFTLRDLVRPRKEILKEIGLEQGFRVLDYGCGPGAYIAGTAELVGKAGKVYALDLQPLALRRVREIARKKQLTNVETICSDCQTGLQDNSLDVVLLYDVFHTLGEPQAVLAELHRVLKKGGTLSFSDHHMSEEEIISGVTGGLLFKLSRKGEHTYQFERA